MRDIDAESIYRKCQVVQGPVTKVPAQFSKERKRGPDPCYLHRFDLKQMRRNKFILEPIENLESNKEKSKVASRTSSSPKVTPLKINLSNLRAKRKLSESENTKGEEEVKVKKPKVQKSGELSKETSPELNSFVTSTVSLDNVLPSPDPEVESRSRRRSSKRVQVHFKSFVLLKQFTFTLRIQRTSRWNRRGCMRWKV